MADLFLPLFAGVYHYGYGFEFDPGRKHIVEFHFNPRDDEPLGSWRIDLYDAARVPLVLGTKLARGRDLWKRYRYKAGMPRGELYVVAVDASGGEAGQDDLGVRVLVKYALVQP